MLRLIIPMLLLPMQALALDKPFTAYPARHLSNGVICQGITGVVAASPGTVDGEVVITDGPRVNYDVTGRQAPARIGLAFGFHMFLEPTSTTTALTASVSHPPMGAHGTTHQTWQVPPFGDISLGYVLEDGFELVTGIWTFQLHDGARLLFKGDFEVLPAGKVEDVQRFCFGRYNGS
jgi:hypothetical protein